MRVYEIFKTSLETLLKANTSAQKVEWYNQQYENTENEKATRYPSNYIEIENDLIWRQLGNKVQVATVQFVIHSVVYDIKDSPVPTYDFAQQVFAALNNKSLFDADGNQICTSITRVRTGRQQRFNQLKAVRSVFSCDLYDFTLLPQHTTLPNPPDLIINS